MGDYDVEVGSRRYICKTRKDRDKVLAALSAALEGEPSAIMRTGGYALRVKRENDDTITVKTSSDQHGEQTAHFRRKTVKDALEYYT